MAVELERATISGTGSQPTLAHRRKKKQRRVAVERSLRQQQEKTEEELESLLFGELAADERLSKAVAEADGVDDGTVRALAEDEDFSALADQELFVVDTGRPTEDDEEGIAMLEDGASPSTTKDQAAWHDEDDEDENDKESTDNLVNIADRGITRKLRVTEEEEEITANDMESRLRQQFQRLHGKPKWATAPSATTKRPHSDDESGAESLGEDDAEAEVERLLQFRDTRCKLLSGERAPVIPPDNLQVARQRDANFQDRSHSTITTLGWHPEAHQLLMTGGLDKTLRLFQIDGRENPKVQSVNFADMPIYNARFSSDGNQVVVAGRRKFFYVYDLQHGRVVKVPEIHRGYDKSQEVRSLENVEVSPCGRFWAFHGRNGEIILVSSRSKQYIGSLQMNGSVRALDFSRDGAFLFSTGGDGEVYQWDLGTRRCVQRFTDEGALDNTTIAVSPANNRLATGNESGIVNLYDAASYLQRPPTTTSFTSTPTPLRALTNLTTFIDQVSFNHDGNLLGFCSRVKKDQFRLVHVPTGRVYQNWPTRGTPMDYVQCFGFSKGSEYLAMGNAKGKVLLYALNYYQSARA